MTDSWLGSTCRRLESAGYVIEREVSHDGRLFPVVARRTRFDLLKFGFSESFFIFHQFDRLSLADFRRFSADAFRCAKAHRAIPLPCGLFESVWCYAVAIANAVDGPALEAIRSETPPKHWAAAEIPVVYDQTLRQLGYFDRTPLWGAAYYAGFRKQINRLLGSA
jgi:hypothetical protein